MSRETFRSDGADKFIYAVCWHRRTNFIATGKKSGKYAAVRVKEWKKKNRLYKSVTRENKRRTVRGPPGP